MRLALWLSPRAFWMLALIALLFALSSALPGLTLVAQSAALIGLIALGADVLLGPARKSIVIERLQADPFALARQSSLHYHVENHSRTFVRLGLIEKQSRLFTYTQEEIAATLPGRSEILLERPMVPIARGSEQFETIYAWFENPIGVLRRRMNVASVQTLRVYPDLAAVERYGNLRVRNRVIEAGLRRMRLRGAGGELESVREWAPGDAFRAMNWKATARRGRFMVSDYEVERSQNVMLLLDAGRLMSARIDAQRKLDYAVTAALSVATIAALASDKIGMVAFSSRILRAYAPAAGRSQARLADALHDLEPRFEEADYGSAFSYVRMRVQKRSLVVLFSDMIDPGSQAGVLAEIRTLARRHLVICAFMNDAVIEKTLERTPQTAAQAYELAVALELVTERQRAAATLERLGVLVVDVPARNLSTALIDRYLFVKQRAMV